MLLGAAACRAERATAAPTGLAALAVAWSGGQADPRCQDRGPRGEYLGPFGEQYCEWEPPAGRRVMGRVSGHVDAAGRPTLLTWERPTTGVADADRLVDSLTSAFEERGLPRRDCGTGEVPAGRVQGVMWEGPALVVHLSQITPPGGVPRLVVMAVDQPEAFPTVACPR